MKRDAIYLLYCIARNWVGMIIFLFLWIVGLMYFIEKTKLIRYSEPWNAIIYSGLSVFLAFKLGQIGIKIYTEKQQFKNWLDAVKSDKTSTEQKIRAANKMLVSPDLDKYALEEMYNNVRVNSPTRDEIIDRLDQIRKTETI